MGQAIDLKAVRGIADSTVGSSSVPGAILDWRLKSLPPAAEGLSIAEFLATGPRLADLQTPLLTLDESALSANIEHFAAWCERHAVKLAPHGKTTMAPQLWARQLDRGAWGVTVANLAQLRVAVHFGVGTVMVANSLTDPIAIRWAAEQAAAGTRIVSWVDNIQTVQRIDAVLAGTGLSLDVLVELGAPGGRTGARTPEAAREVADAVVHSEHLSLRGVSGYEGSLAHTAEASALAAVRSYLISLRALHTELTQAGAYAPGEVIVTAGGSAYFDLVVEELADLAGEDSAGDQTSVVLRSGAYLVHDNGFYEQISPFSRTPGEQPLVAGMHGWARVVSLPEPGLAILDAGKRDLPFDEGLPVPQGVAAELGAPLRPLGGAGQAASIVAINDQHCYLRFDAGTDDLRIGEVVRLGLSHPCTAFDKWQLIPVLDQVDSGQVVDLIRTFF
ncbi:alanine racemase [Psychromicrobium xiongbiense]|uniref:alanine racemase n=1 Tax=Psychromicrobium xiongbiense TaxID=3051184 RepID=UPI002554D763|nr:alanine racemase [Psychromicrobium sp. YIM S02556]